MSNHRLESLGHKRTSLAFVWALYPFYALPASLCMSEAALLQAGRRLPQSPWGNPPFVAPLRGKFAQFSYEMPSSQTGIKFAPQQPLVELSPRQLLLAETLRRVVFPCCNLSSSSSLCSDNPSGDCHARAPARVSRGGRFDLVWRAR
jgi:hypothetical protein